MDRSVELPFPVPTRTVPADESESPRQSADQRRVQQLAEDLAQEYGQKLCMTSILERNAAKLFNAQT